MITRFLMAGILLVVPLTALADYRALYVGLQLGDYDFESPPVNPNIEERQPAMYVGRLGYRFNRIFAVEGRFANGRTHDPVAALFTRLAVPFRATDIYFLVGASEVRPNDFPLEGENNLAHGLGITFYGTGDMAIDLEYVNYSDDALRGIGIGFSVEF